jgi:hypothetical protein
LRIQGGSSGILSALSSGRLDPLDASFERDRSLGLSEQESDRRARRRRMLRRHKRAYRLQRLHDADMV